MPANIDEIYKIKNIVDFELGSETAYKICKKLWDDVGINSTNESLKLTFLMLAHSYDAVPSELQTLYESYGKAYDAPKLPPTQSWYDEEPIEYEGT